MENIKSNRLKTKILKELNTKLLSGYVAGYINIKHNGSNYLIKYNQDILIKEN